MFSVVQCLSLYLKIIKKNLLPFTIIIIKENYNFWPLHYVFWVLKLKMIFFLNVTNKISMIYQKFQSSFLAPKYSKSFKTYTSLVFDPKLFRDKFQVIWKMFEKNCGKKNKYDNHEIRLFFYSYCFFPHVFVVFHL